MTEKLDLGDFDLDSLIGSCDSDEPPSSPEDLLACLEADMDLDLNSLPFSSSELELPLPLDLPLSESTAEPEKSQVLVEIKSEPPSPAPSPDSTPSSPHTLDLGSEIDVSELMKSSTLLQSSAIELNTSPFHIIVVLTPKEEMSVSSTSDLSDSDSGVSVSGSPAHRPDPAASPKPAGSSRTQPYSRPDPVAVSAVTGRLRTGAPKVVEKKLKKMEQNKTAATRYRQKKRVEQETLNTECADMERRNQELAEKADSISREIQYLKNLMEEVRSAKHRKAKVGSS